MALADFIEQLDKLAASATAAFDEAGETDAREAARVEFLGAKKGRLKAVQKNMGSVEPADRPAAGTRHQG